MFPLPLPFSAPLLACLGWGAFGPATSFSDEVLMHAPGAGTSRTARLTTELNLEGGSLEVLMDDEEVPSMYLPDLNLDLTDRRELEVTETFGEDSWLRRHDTVAWESQGSMTMDMGGAEQMFPWSETPDSPVEGRVLRLTRDGDGAMECEPADGEDLEAALLERLAIDLSLVELLPAAGDGPPAPGDTWIVPGVAMAPFFDVGGGLGWDLSDEAREQLAPAYDERSVGGHLEVTWAEVQGDHAHLSLEGSLVHTMVKPGDLGHVPVVDGTATDTITETWEARGELVWDLGTHQVLELRLAGDLDQKSVTLRDPDQEGPTYSSTFLISGSYRVELAVETSAEALLGEER